MLAGCGSESIKQQVHNSQPALANDVDLLNRLLHLEHVGIAAYTAGIPLLDQPTAKAGQLFLNDEISHAGDVAGLVREAGGKPIKPAPSYALGHPRTSEEVLMLLHRSRTPRSPATSTRSSSSSRASSSSRWPRFSPTTHSTLRSCGLRSGSPRSRPRS